MLIQKQSNILVLLKIWNEKEMFFIFVEAKEKVLDFLKDTVRAL